MTIPTTAKAFERWYFAHLNEWPQELRDKGQRALLILQEIAGNPPAKMELAKEFAPNAWASMCAGLMAFAEAYEAHAKPE